MLRRLSHRLLTLLQLTRMALVFTAIADSLCALLLSARQQAAAGASLLPQLPPLRVAAVAAISAGLYGFGMSLNDIIDRRRDSQIAAHRPLPSGRMGVVTAHAVAALLAMVALLGGAYLAADTGQWFSFGLVVWTGLLIAFYDLAGKYLVWPGLLTLGLIRFFHAIIPAQPGHLLWHPLLLLNHVTLLSAVAYVWEEKRPPLTRRHWVAVIGGLLVLDILAVAMVAARRLPQQPGGGWSAFASALHIQPGLIAPLSAAAVFVLLAWWVRRASTTSRGAGQTLMLYGLLWLIAYDAAFVAGYVRSWPATLVVLLLLPVAYFAVQLMRWWSKLMTLSQRPTFKRART